MSPTKYMVPAFGPPELEIAGGWTTLGIVEASVLRLDVSIGGARCQRLEVGNNMLFYIMECFSVAEAVVGRFPRMTVVFTVLLTVVLTVVFTVVQLLAASGI